jgi:4-amino-4-deoxy-L-arabinose transferase-like glycosyltransferase
MKIKIALLLTLIAVGIVLVATSSHYGMTWDEPYYFQASKLHLEWSGRVLQGFRTGDSGSWLEDKDIIPYWHWDPYHVPHTPFTRILSGLTWVGFRSLLGEVSAFRLSTVLFFLALLFIVWVWTKSLVDGPSAWLAMFATMTMPHLFGHAHFAMTDIPITTLWAATVYAYWRGLEKTSWSVAFGLFLGLAMATKFPGFLIPAPLLLWSFLYREIRPKIYRNIFAALFISPLILVGLNPYFWHQTLPRILEFIFLSTTRPSFGNLFFNKIYPTDQLPWYYSFFMVAMTTPATVLALIPVGLFLVVVKAKSRPDYTLPLICALFLLVLPLMPGAVIHDGVRLLLPVFPFLAVISGVGFQAALQMMGRIFDQKGLPPGVLRILNLILMVVILFPAGLSLFSIHPFELSYYNALIGGVRGADRKGLEVTYLQEVITPEFLSRLNRLLPAGSSLNGTMSQFLLIEYQKRGVLRKDIRLVNGAEVDYYLILMRKSSLRGYFDERPPEKALIDRWGRDGKEPLLVRSVQGVPLLLLYKVK